MKAKHHAILSVGMALAACGRLVAIETPEDTAPPPNVDPTPVAPVEQNPELGTAPERPLRNSEALRQHVIPAPAPEARDTTAFLGIVTRPIPEVLAAHLGVPAGAGVVVDSLLPDGPAAKAGLVENDIVRKADGQVIESAESLNRSIAARKPGDVVALDLLRKGKPLALQVTLGERPAGLPMSGRRVVPMNGNFRFEGMPDEMTERLQEMLEGNIGMGGFEEFDRRFGNGVDGGIHEKMDQAIADAHRQLSEDRNRMNVPVPPLRELKLNSMATVRIMDGKGSVELKSNEGKRKLTVRDPKGDVSWSGPWTTEEDKAAAPADVRERAKSLNLEAEQTGNSFRFKLNGKEIR
ncbi:MAG: PDZ domain-containing protein [Verrucomicrobiota bacterium]